MKRLIIILLSLILVMPVCSYADENATVPDALGADVSESEDYFFFPSKILADSIYTFMVDKDAAATEYTKWATEENEYKVSLEQIYQVCTAGGLDMGTDEGTATCQNFLQDLLEQTAKCVANGGEECTSQLAFNPADLGQFCPVKGNKLKSITGENVVGDPCSSTNHIAVGTVVKLKNKNKDGTRSCSCSAIQCVPGAVLENYQCKRTDPNGNCLRQELNRVKKENCNTKCQREVADKAAGGCKINAVIEQDTKCICNPKTEEIQAEADKRAQLAAAKKAAQQPKTVTYFDACDVDKSKYPDWTFSCIEAFKDVKTVQQYGVQLATDWLKVHKKVDAQCEKTFRTKWNDDYLSCTVIGKKVAYEFQFNSLNASLDQVVHLNTRKALLTIVFDYKNIDEFKTATGYPVQGPDGVTYLSLGSSVCPNNTEPNKYLTKYGATMVDYKISSGGYGQTLCVVGARSNTKTGQGYELSNPYGLDPWAFYNNSQAQYNSKLLITIQKYLAAKLNAQKIYFDGIRCGDFGFTKYSTDKTLCAKENVNGQNVCKKTTGTGDDVYRCSITVQGKTEHIDFVFDDLTEQWPTYANDTSNAITCAAGGGVYGGNACLGVSSQSECTKLGNELIKNCPTCKKPVWDAKALACNMPDAATAAHIKQEVQKLQIAANIGVGVLITVATAGTGTVVMASVAITTAGAMLAADAKRTAENAATPLLKQMYACNNIGCARNFIKDRAGFQRLENLKDRFTPTDKAAAEQAIVHILELVPANDSIWDEYAEQIANQSALENIELENALITAGQALEVAGALVGFVAAVKTALPTSANLLNSRLNAVWKNPQRLLNVMRALLKTNKQLPKSIAKQVLKTCRTKGTVCKEALELVINYGQNVVQTEAKTLMCNTYQTCT